MKRVYLSLIVLFFALNTYAQHWGYVITNSNDTIHCVKVKINYFTHAFKYKVNENDDFQSSTDIKEYQLSNDSAIWRAEVIGTNDESVFLRVEVNGKICLYQQVIKTTMYGADYNYINNNSTTTSTKNWFVSKDNGELIPLKTSALFVVGASRNDRKTTLADMFADNPQVAAEYKADDSFNFKNIKKYVQQYDHDAALVNRK